jgi:hypothetical protein
MPFPRPFVAPFGYDGPLPPSTPPILFSGVPPTLPRTVAPSYYGTDISILNGDLAFVTQTGLQNLSNAILRRWQTPRGGLFYDPNYGTDLRDWVNAKLDPADQARLGGLAEDEAEKDERITQATVTTNFTILTNGFQISAAFLSSLGPFSLIANVSQMGIQLLRASQ